MTAPFRMASYRVVDKIGRMGRTAEYRLPWSTLMVREAYKPSAALLLINPQIPNDHCPLIAQSICRNGCIRYTMLLRALTGLKFLGLGSRKMSFPLLFPTFPKKTHSRPFGGAVSIMTAQQFFFLRCSTSSAIGSWKLQPFERNPGHFVGL